MNILGISGSVGWDGNISMFLPGCGEAWVHGSGASLVMDGVLKNAINEERFSRLKYDGNYPELAIKNILQANNLTNEDIDIVVKIGSCCTIDHDLREAGYIETKLKEKFPNCKEVIHLSHHMAHVAATYYTSGFESANVFSFDGAGDYVWVEDRFRVPHFIFCQCEGLEIKEISAGYSNDPDTFFGAIYGSFATICYRVKMEQISEEDDPKIFNLRLKFPDKEYVASTADRETYPGKVMGMAAYGDYTKIDLPDIFVLDTESSIFPQLHNNPDWLPETGHPSTYKDNLVNLPPEDLAAWSQNQFEKYLSLFLDNIPESLKKDNLCLGGGCALNILANTKIVEQGIYKNLHVNTAPNDDGLCLGAALWATAEYEKVRPIIPVDVGYLGINYSDEDIEKAIKNLP